MIIRWAWVLKCPLAAANTAPSGLPACPHIYLLAAVTSFQIAWLVVIVAVEMSLHWWYWGIAFLCGMNVAEFSLSWRCRLGLTGLIPFDYCVGRIEFCYHRPKNFF